MTDYIVRETEYPLATGQEVMGELIRCRECKHYTQGYTAPMCTNCIVKYVKPDDFCSWGERREENAPYDGK